MTSATPWPKKVLFFAEAVTLAHVARPVALAKGLDPSRYKVTLASAPRYEALHRDLAVRPIESLSVETFLDALAKGRPLYDAATLRRYVAEDLAVIEECAPDLIVGDFRLSLSVSARVAKVPYLALTNAYWSPYARLRFPVPELPMVDQLGLPLARIVFGLARPLAFALHTRPLNKVRREHGLPTLGLDLRRVYTDADHTAYADVPELVPTDNLPANHHYLGPIFWSPDVAMPAWWHRLIGENPRPVVYVTMGSSGASRRLSDVLDALADLPVFVIAATLGSPLARPAPANALLADYLPGREAAAVASLVICNGGSPTTHQALAAGIPVVGLASNLDQHLNMQGVERLGAGVLVRSDRATPEAIRAASRRVLDRPEFRRSARDVATLFSRYDSASRFGSLIDSLLAADVPPSLPGSPIATGI